MNQAIVEKPTGPGCGGSPRDVRGWYTDLVYGGDALAFKPTIADVHTQWTDENGNPVGLVLHVGTGAPRLMVVDVGRRNPGEEEPQGRSRYFVGVVSDYAEYTTSRFRRLTDQDWEGLIAQRNPEDVAWMRDLVVR